MSELPVLHEPEYNKTGPNDQVGCELCVTKGIGEMIGLEENIPYTEKTDGEGTPDQTPIGRGKLGSVNIYLIIHPAIPVPDWTDAQDEDSDDHGREVKKSFLGDSDDTHLK